MAKDYFADLKKQPYPLFVAPRPYSFDLNEDMLRMIREEFGAEVAAAKLAEAIKGKPKGEIEKAGKQFFEEFGQQWMNRVMQLGEEYPDRTIEVILESIDRDGNQFMVFPHVPQRYVEIAYLATQQFLKLPINDDTGKPLGPLGICVGPSGDLFLADFQMEGDRKSRVMRIVMEEGHPKEKRPLELLRFHASSRLCKRRTVSPNRSR